MDEINSTRIKEAQLLYIDRLRSIGKSPQTVKAYRQGIQHFLSVLTDHDVDINGPLDQLSIASFDWMIQSLAKKSDSSRRLYTTAVTGFLEYLDAMDMLKLDFVKIQILKKSSTKRVAQKLPQFSKDNIYKVLDYAQSLNLHPAEDYEDKLRNYRDRALLLTLADTGLRIQEACNLLRKSIDFNEGRAIVIGKGDKEAMIRFTTRSLQAIRDYLNLRAKLDGELGKNMNSLPIFMRHNRPLGKKNKAKQHLKISTEAGRDIVNKRVLESLGPDAVGTITPHSFRHYFVTMVLNTTDNVRVAQELARHSNISTTTRYTHLTNQELDQVYYDTFENQ